jgi:hypothetical protein
LTRQNGAGFGDGHNRGGPHGDTRLDNLEPTTIPDLGTGEVDDDHARLFDASAVAHDCDST